MNTHNQNNIAPKFILLLAAFICLFTATAHMSCIWLGPECFSYQMAPAELVESSKNGTLLAPIGTIVVSSIFVGWALYAISAAGYLRRLPFLKVAIYSIAFLCIARGLLGIQLWIRKPERVTEFANVSNWLWLLTGVLFLVGYIWRCRIKRTH